MVPVDENHSFLDRPEILDFIFYPRREENPVPSAPNATNVVVPVDSDVSVGCRFYDSQKSGPNILFFHGNGEIVSDYDFIAPIYTDKGLNLFVADYRGYGFSGGTPTTTSMIQDAHPIFRHLLKFLQKIQHTGPIYLMGRSLGSASALELGSHYQEKLQGLIIESGFADTFDLLGSLGIPVAIPPDAQDRVFSNLQKIEKISLPTLIIHAEKDHIVPLRHGKDLFRASPAEKKRLIIIPGANHNDLLMVGRHQYFEALTDFTSVGRNREDTVDG
ncbi:MAG: alpha/beta fold hydrolase [Proteobacteria bacterium]|nr:alpha/beta fold hydrolase [Pseudomonadota bacterium]